MHCNDTSSTDNRKHEIREKRRKRGKEIAKEFPIRKACEFARGGFANANCSARLKRLSSDFADHILGSSGPSFDDPRLEASREMTRK